MNIKDQRVEKSIYQKLNQIIFKDIVFFLM